MADDVVPEPDALRARVGDVVGRVFEASQFGMPTEDPHSALEVMWASFEALVAAHFPGTGADRPDPGVGDATHWSRVLVTAVTNTVLLGGGFVRPVDVVGGADALLADEGGEGWWHTRRPAGPGALVLRAHRELDHLQRHLATGGPPGPTEDAALRRLAAVAALGAALAEAQAVGPPPGGRPVDGPTQGPVAAGPAAERDPAGVAEAFGIPGVELVPVGRRGWACAICGCLFTGRVEDGVAYPDRYAPVGRHGPCDSVAPCVCHAAPVQRRLDG